MIPYGRQWIDEEDIQSVIEVLRSDWLTTGPWVERFEEAAAKFIGAQNAVVVSSGTAALHAAMVAAGIGPGDEVLLPPMTFVATANAVVFQGGRPVFVDVDPGTLLIDPARVEARITPRTKAMIAVDYAGHPCDYDELRKIARRHGLILIADACHAIGAEYKGQKVGALADLTIFSFHPVKHITTGEGGMVLTHVHEWAVKMRRFRNHGLQTDHRERFQQNTWVYEMKGLGFNYRLTDFQCALGLSQLRKLPAWINRRREIACQYDRAFMDISAIKPLHRSSQVKHAFHLYVVRVDFGQWNTTRPALFTSLRKKGIGVNVHYIPVHLQPFYRERLGTGPGDCPVAELAYEQILSLPIFPRMSDADIQTVVEGMLSERENHPG
jgi:perosamine synthetase